MAKNNDNLDERQEAILAPLNETMNEVVRLIKQRKDHEELGRKLEDRLQAAVAAAAKQGWPIKTLVDLGAPRPPKTPRPKAAATQSKESETDRPADDHQDPQTDHHGGD